MLTMDFVVAYFLPYHFIICAFDTCALRVEIAENIVPCRASNLFNAAKFDRGLGGAQLMPVAKCTIGFEITKESLPPPGYGRGGGGGIGLVCC
mmetsp:Transcript_7931/g.13804  ORF Transcript_7931/g.13804 Transcript_7931/m.13804 type:complete len:93 (-) Transcript_7931:499-777(-)